MAISDNVLRQIEQVESSGNPRAANPRSSALGLYQFLSGTWMDTVRKHAPDLLEGRTEDEVLALRTDPAISRRLGRAFTEDNARYLQAAGVEVTPGRLYLAHFLGAGGARKALSADAGASVADVLGEGVVDANPFLYGATISDLEDWASKKMGGVKMQRSAPEVAGPEAPFAERPAPAPSPPSPRRPSSTSMRARSGSTTGSTSRPRVRRMPLGWASSSLPRVNFSIRWSILGEWLRKALPI